MFEPLIFGLGLGLTMGIANGIVEAYKKGHWLWAFLLMSLGLVTAIESRIPLSGRELTDFSFLLTSIPTFMLASWKTKKTFAVESDLPEKQTP